jgi:hypothetical protein
MDELWQLQVDILEKHAGSQTNSTAQRLTRLRATNVMKPRYGDKPSVLIDY